MYYRPKNAVAADVIPFFENGEFKLFYLKDYRNVKEHGEGCPWHLITTKNFVDYTEHGEMLGRGSENEQDLYVFTGSVFKDKGKYYIFYTGHNPHLRAKGLPEQAVLMAESDDLIHWTKNKDFIFFAPEKYEMHDFRDPFVYYDDKSEEYKMLLAGRTKSGAASKRGCTLRASSTNLTDWVVEDKLFYYPENYFTHECPDLFRIGDWWYLVFSEFTDKVCTRYRMSRSPEGPWITPQIDTFDNRSFYAAKTASDGKKRYLFGWNPIRLDEKDYNPWQWGGTVVVHEIVQSSDGTLYVKCPDEVKNQYIKPVDIKVTDKSGNVEKEGGVYKLGSREGYSRISFNEMPENCRIHASIKLVDKCKDFGIYLRADKDFDKAYFVKFEPMYNRLCFDRTQRPMGDMQFMVESERYCPLQPGEWNDVDIIVEGSVAEVYVNDKVAMSVRMFDYKKGYFGIYASDTVIEVKDVQLTE